MSVPDPRPDALTVRYGSLFTALDASVCGLLLAGPDLAPRGRWGEACAEFDPVLRATGWNTSPPARTATLGRDLGAGRYLLVLPLISDSERLLGAVALKVNAPSTGALQALRTRLAPALECLRQEISGADAALRATELQLVRAATQLEVNFDAGVSLEKLLAASLTRGGGQAAMLLVPGRGIHATSQREGQLAAEVAQELAGLRGRLRALAGQLRRPLLINGPGLRLDRAAHCQLLIVPLQLCQGRVEALLAYLKPLDSPPFGAMQMLLLQTGATLIGRRLEADLDRRTGLLNRTGLEEVLRRIKRGMGSLVLIDVDRLHAVNEVQGFEAGDALIGAIAELLRRPLLPKGAYAARLFGGCYAVLLPDLEAGAATDLAGRIQNAVGQLRVGDTAQLAPITVSCGVAEIRSLAEPLAKAVVAAEVVLKLAKERGRSRIEVHVSENSSIIRRHDEVFAAADLREALRTRQLLLYAQKIVSLRDRDGPPGFELLVRLCDAQTGEIRPPQEFMAAAQRYQLLPQVDRYVVDLALQLLAPHRALLSRQRASISLNISGQSVGDPQFVDHFLEKLKESQLPPGTLIVEITEQAAVMNLTQAGQMMRRLRDAGCGIALDDFGTGASSLAYLRTLPATRIKIDGSFVKDILTNPRSEAAVRGIAQLARSFNLDSVAEFVETNPVAEKLRQIGIDRGQGYLFGKPEPLQTALWDLEKSESAELHDILQFN